jgi:hypothetical protein
MEEESLPEPPEGGPESENDEVSKEVESIEERNADSFIADQQARLRDLAADLDELEMVEFHYEDLVAAQQGAPVNPGEVVADGGQPDDLQDNLDQAVERIRAQPDERAQWNTQRYIAIFSGIGGIAGMVSLIYEIVHNATTGDDDKHHSDDNPLPDEVKDKVRKLVREWWSRSDTEYWGDLADAADNPKLALTIQDQILFMNYTIDLSPTTTWIWRTSDDIVAVVNQLLTAYANAGSKTSAMYTLVPTITYLDTSSNQEVALPRPVAASVLRYALSNILIDPVVPPS